jgi:peptide-methionine (R)-S-oxide reductase
MRQKGTEKPFTGKYVKFDDKGVYRCGACGQPLFGSDAKFQTECGWPGFDNALPQAVKIRKDYSHSMERDEVICSKCGSHLGHLFDDGPTKTGKRFCINSVAVDFEEQK